MSPTRIRVRKRVRVCAYCVRALRAVNNAPLLWRRRKLKSVLSGLEGLLGCRGGGLRRLCRIII